MPKVFCDFHHQDLYHSLHMLFEERLGWEMYRPIGVEWWKQGYWKVYNHPATAAQYLGLHHGTDTPCDVHGNSLLESDCKNLHYVIEDGIHYVKDVTHKVTYRAVRLDKFREMDFDILLSSMPAHVGPFNKLIAECQPKAKHIFQVGNAWTGQTGVANIMASTTPFGTKANTVFYHQEFDLDVFKYEPPVFHNVIHSYIHYMQNKGLLYKFGNCLPGWQVMAYGAGMELPLQGIEAMAEAHRRSAFTWHYKPGGDGYGHVLHGSYACGRPALIWRKHYHGCLADNLFEDKITCIDISNKPMPEIVRLLKKYSQPEEHNKMCEAAYKRFKKVVDFDEEFQKIKKFLERLR